MMVTDTPGVMPTTIRLGTILPLSGPMSVRGQLALGGLKAGLARANRERGPHGRELVLLALDDEFDPTRTNAIVQQLVEVEQVFCLVAPLGTPTNKAIIDYLVRNEVPVVAPLSGSSLLSIPPKRNYFALQVNYVVEGTLLARYAVETLGAKRIAIFYSNDDFGQEGVRAFHLELDNFHLQPVHVERSWRGESLAASVIVERLRAAEPDTVLIYAYMDQAAELLREAERQKFHPRWLGSYILWDPVFFDLAGPQAVEGMIVGQPYLDPLGPEPAAEFYRLDLSVFARETKPGGYSASGYTAACLMAEGLRRAGLNLTRAGLITALEGLQNWSGGLVTGISYSRHDRRGSKRLSLARATGGRWATVTKTTLALRDQLLTMTAPLAMQVSILSRQAMEELGKERIRQKATDVARQCAIFIRHHPDWDLEALQANEEFRRIAVQSIGRTGYTALYGPAPFPAMRLHPNPELVNMDLRATDRPTRFPDWWRQYQHSLSEDGQEGGGFYNWADADGIARQKYQYFLPVEGTRYILAATTYLEEFFQPFEEAEQAIRRTVNDLTAEITRQILDPIQGIMEGVERVSQGALDVEIKLGPTEEAQSLAQAFNRMTRSLRSLSERWIELNRELETRVVERTQELAETNRQLQISNRSLQEINRQLNEAKTAAERAQLEAEEANRLKSRFLSNISHELRTPLNAIINFSKLLLVGGDGPLTGGQADLLGRIRDAGGHLLGLLNDMLDLSRIESGAVELFREETDLAEIIRGVMSTAVGLTRDKPIQLHQEIAEGLPPVWVDRTRIRQVLLNLVANAAKFTERGTVAVRAEARGHQILVSVRDTGPGIPASDRAHIFERYVKGKADNQQGIGLGLAISRQLVEMHGGSIWVDSEPGRGSTFCFTVPVVHPVEAALAPSRRDSQSLVLVVDTDRATYRCLTEPLTERGFRVISLADPSMMIGKVSHLQPAAIVLDVWKVSGAEQLIRSLQTDGSSVPLLRAAYRPEDERGLWSPESLSPLTVVTQLEPVEFVDRVSDWLNEHVHQVE